MLNAEDMRFIADELCIGIKLAAGVIQTSDIGGIEAAGPLPEEGIMRLERIPTLFDLKDRISRPSEALQEKVEPPPSAKPSAVHRAARQTPPASSARRAT